MIGMYQVKKVSSGVSRFKFCWSKVNPQTVTIFENKMPSIDRIEFSSQLVPLFVFVFVQQLFWCVRPNLENTGLKSIIQQMTWEWHLCVVGHLLRFLLDLVELVASLTHLNIMFKKKRYIKKYAKYITSHRPYIIFEIYRKNILDILIHTHRLLCLRNLRTAGSRARLQHNIHI